MALVLGGKLPLSEEKTDLNCFRRISTLFSGLLNNLPFTLSGETPTLSFFLALTKFQNGLVLLLRPSCMVLLICLHSARLISRLQRFWILRYFVQSWVVLSFWYCLFFCLSSLRRGIFIQGRSECFFVDAEGMCRPILFWRLFKVGPHIIRTLVVAVLFLDGFSCGVKICFQFVPVGLLKCIILPWLLRGSVGLNVKIRHYHVVVGNAWDAGWGFY